MMAYVYVTARWESGPDRNADEAAFADTSVRWYRWIVPSLCLMILAGPPAWIGYRAVQRYSDQRSTAGSRQLGASVYITESYGGPQWMREFVEVGYGIKTLHVPQAVTIELTDVSGLGNCTSLVSLSLDGCGKLTDVSGLGNCTTLHSIRLNGCAKVDRCEPLGELHLGAQT